MLVDYVLVDRQPKCIYGVADVRVSKSRGAMEIKFWTNVDELGPPSEGVQ